MNNSSNKANSSKVAAIARRTGVSVRTLHYYEEIGLLCPSARTASGHRLYTRSEVEKLKQIRRLQHLGMGLSQIADCFEAGRIDGRKVVQDRLERVENELRDLEQQRSFLFPSSFQNLTIPDGELTIVKNALPRPGDFSSTPTFVTGSGTSALRA